MAASTSVGDLCRLCGTDTLNIVRNAIFEGEGRVKKYALKISECLTLQVTQEDRLPKIMCGECTYKLDLISDFRDKAFKTETLLISKLDLDVVKPEIPDEDDGPDLNNDDVGGDDFHSSSPEPPIEPEVVVKEEDHAVEKRPGCKAATKRSMRESESEEEEEEAPAKKRGRKPKETPTATATAPVAAPPKENTGRRGVGVDRFGCPLCLRPMRNSTSLRCHVWSHAKGKQLQCAHCSKAFGARCLLAAHVAAKHLRLERPYPCPLCAGAFRSARGLVAHYARKHPRTRHADLDFLCCLVRLNVMRCAACGKRFINKAQLHEHEAMHTGVKRYSCKHCGRAFKTGSLVRRHEIAHHGRPSNFVCRICGRQLASTQELTLHEAAHDSVKAFECAHCAHHYKHKESLLTHIRQQHLGMARIYVCAACGYQTTKRSRHETHVVLHQPQPSPCPKCPQVLGDEFSLRKHVDMHRPFACLRCEKRFDARHNLNMHMRVHEGGQTFTCVVCGRTLMSATRLRIHMRYHTGEQPRHCSLCPASFKEITPLKTHMRKVHNVKPYACEHCNHRFDFVRDVRAHAKAEH